jgi:hypothetical protein
MGIDLLEIYMEVADHFGIEEETLVPQLACPTVLFLYHSHHLKIG